MKYAAEMGSGAMIYIPSFVTIGSGIQEFMEGYTCRQQDDLISLLLLLSFQNKENGIKYSSFVRGLLYFYATQKTRLIHPDHSLLGKTK
jgi:hypothetical protein